MPYIKPNRREVLDPFIERLQGILDSLGFQEGDLNYVITRLVGFYFRSHSGYSTVAKITGILKNVSDEFYRRLVTDYEDTAKFRHGDIPEFMEKFND